MTEAREMKLLSRQQPHIETLQVSVQVVRIGPKQMTQAVFRQLKNEALVAQDTLELRGVPWGTVHYNPGDCDPPGWPMDHVHVVWQRGDQLRRDCFPLRYWDATQQELGGRLLRASRNFSPVVESPGYVSPRLPPPVLQDVLDRAEAAHAKNWPTRLPTIYRKAIDDFAQALEMLEDSWPAIQSRHARWQEHVEEIETLPQLFIAV